MATTLDIVSGNRISPSDRVDSNLSARKLTNVGLVKGITKTPGVCGGDACIRNLRVPVWQLEAGRQLGISDTEQMASFIDLNQSDLDNAWAYVESNREEIERALRENEEA